VVPVPPPLLPSHRLAATDAMKTSHALILSSGAAVGRLLCWEGDGFVVGLAGVQAVVLAAQQPVEQVALGGDVAVPGGFAAVVVGAGAG